MQSIPFIKYHGAGNDFILIDDRKGMWGDKMDEAWIAGICHRRFGIGADGLILLQAGRDGADFFMKYYNADGKPSTFCCNGGRCIVSFAAQLGIHSGTCKFLGTDGWHTGLLNAEGLVSLTMADVSEINRIDQHTYILFTGSPHYVTFVDDLKDMDIRLEGRSIRNSKRFEKEGINVNFVEIKRDVLHIRTYERGVEDETLSCGTGVTAVAVAVAVAGQVGAGVGVELNTNNGLGDFSFAIKTLGGDLNVKLKTKDGKKFSDVFLEGSATFVFTGIINPVP